MRRIRVLRRPTPVEDIDAIVDNEYLQPTPLKTTRAELRQWRQLKHQLG